MRTQVGGHGICIAIVSCSVQRPAVCVQVCARPIRVMQGYQNNERLELEDFGCEPLEIEGFFSCKLCISALDSAPFESKSGSWEGCLD